MDVVDNRKEGVFYKLKNCNTWKKISKIKNIRILAALFIIAIGLVIYSSVASSKANGMTDQTVSQTVTMDAEEQKLAKILSGIEGAGTVEVFISRQAENIAGVLVIAEGADNAAVRFRLLDATCTALNVEKKLVDVYKKK